MGLTTCNVTIDRENCISCCNGHTNCPDVFELNTGDNQSQIRRPYRIKEGLLGEGVVPDSLEGCVRTAEDLCPVGIIHVIRSG